MKEKWQCEGEVGDDGRLSIDGVQISKNNIWIFKTHMKCINRSDVNGFVYFYPIDFILANHSPTTKENNRHTHDFGPISTRHY